MNGYTNEKLEKAIEALKEQGYVIEGNGQPMARENDHTFDVDRRRISESELLAMAAPRPPSIERYKFTADGKTGGVHFHYYEGGYCYETYLDGQQIGKCKPTIENQMTCAQRVAAELGANPNAVERF